MSAGSTFGGKSGFAVAQRLNRSLTAQTERRVLEWMARRAPAWVTSDRLTVLGLSAQFGAGLGFSLTRYHRYWLLAVCLCTALNWLGDSLDGTLARVRHRQRPRYGFYVDHIVDIFGATALMTGLAASGLAHGAVAMAMLISFLLLAAESYLATYTLGRFEMSQGFLGPTEIRILLVAGALDAWRSPYVTLLGHRLLLFDIGGAVASGAMLTIAIAVAIRHTAQLCRQEPLP